MPERTSKKDLQRWRDRLRHARHVWKEHGIIGTGASTMRMMIEFYRGNHWTHLLDAGGGHFHGLVADDLAQVNKTFAVANRILAGTAARNPRVQLHPRNQNSVNAAPVAEAVLNYDIEEMHMIRPLNRALGDHLFAPSGIIRHGFTPGEEFQDERGRRLSFYQPARPDKPWIRRIPMWDCLMDPDASSWHTDGDMKWVAFRSLLTLDQIKRNPNMVARRDLRPNVSRERKEMIPRALRGENSNPDENDFVELWTIYEIEERTWFQLTEDGTEDLLRPRDDWPIDWEWLPVNVLGMNEQMDSPFPVPLLEQMLPIQMELNKLETMMSLLTRMLRRIVIGNKDAFGDEWDKLVDSELLEFFGVQGDPNQLVKEIQVGGLPQELLLRRQALEQDIREIAGESQMDLAQRINVESAREAAQVQAGANAFKIRYQTHFEQYASEVIRTYMQGRRQTTTEEEVVPIVGEDEAGKLTRNFLTASPESLRGEFDYEVVVGSTLPKDRDREAQRALADVEVALRAPDVVDVAKAFKRYFEARGVDPVDAMRPEALASSQVRSLDEIAGDSSDRRTTGGGGGATFDPLIAQ